MLYRPRRRCLPRSSPLSGSSPSEERRAGKDPSLPRKYSPAQSRKERRWSARAKQEPGPGAARQWLRLGGTRMAANSHDADRPWCVSARQLSDRGFFCLRSSFPARDAELQTILTIPAPLLLSSGFPRSIRPAFPSTLLAAGL